MGIILGVILILFAVVAIVFVAVDFIRNNGILTKNETKASLLLLALSIVSILIGVWAIFNL